MHEFDFSIFDEEGDMYDSEEDVFDLENTHTVAVDLVVYLSTRDEPVFAQHVFYFEKEDPVESLRELMNFVATWWAAITEDKNIDFIYLSDSSFNKKALKIADVSAVSFVTPQEPEWMINGKHDSDSG